MASIPVDSLYYKDYQNALAKADTYRESHASWAQSGNPRVKSRFANTLAELDAATQSIVNRQLTRDTSIAKVKAQDLARDAVNVQYAQDRKVAIDAYNAFNTAALKGRRDADYIRDDANNYVGSGMTKEAYDTKNKDLHTAITNLKNDHRASYGQIKTDWDGFVQANTILLSKIIET